MGEIRPTYILEATLVYLVLNQVIESTCRSKHQEYLEWLIYNLQCVHHL
jgi:hypothetical protein